MAWEIASRLAASGKANITWYSSDTDEAPADRPGLRCVSVNACNVIERHLGFPFPLWSPSGLARLVRSVCESDVVHLHDCLYLANFVAWAAARLSRCPVIITQHVGMIPYRSPVLRVVLVGANRFFGALVLGGATQAVFVSHVVLNYFAKFVRFRSPPLRLPNGVDVNVFVPASEERRTVLRTQLEVEGTPLLLFVGRFVEKKGLRLLNLLAQNLPQMRWVFVGRGPLDPSDWGLPNVCVQHDLTKEQLAPLFQAADLLVLPSVGEGFPLVVQEAMACGTPALVSEETAAGSPEAAGLLLQESLKHRDAALRWSARIEALFASPETLLPLRTRVAAFAHANWSWEYCVNRYAEILQASTP